METPVFHPVGTPVLELDTPALVVDLDVMDANLTELKRMLSGSTAGVRPDAARHSCPTLGHRQLAVSGRAPDDIKVNGIRVNTVGEAEVFAGAGFGDILVADPVVTKSKIARLCALARSAKISVTVDDPANAGILSATALESGVNLDILIKVDAGSGLFGVAPGSPALSLAREIARSPSLSLMGLTASLGRADSPRVSSDGSRGPAQDQAADDVDLLRQVLETSREIQGEGLDAPVVSLSGAADLRRVAETPGVTEIQDRGFGLMDYNQCLHQPLFAPSAKVLAGVLSHPIQGLVVLDAGHKSTGPDLGLPVLEGINGARTTRFSAEHGMLEVEDGAAGRLDPGDKVWLVPFDLGMCANQYDYIRSVRGGRLEGYWAISARGRFS
jgi:3-hydroxy-D-aspartate aldolase